MRAERPSRDGFEHRPLPSVDIPLLAHQRRAARARQVLIGSAAALGLAGIIAAVTYGGSRASGAGSPPDPEADLAPAAAMGAAEGDGDGATEDGAPSTGDATSGPAADTPTRIVRPFGKALGFQDALVRAGCSGSDAAALVVALDDLVDFRHCRPEHQLVFERSEAGELQGFEYVISTVDRYRAERGPDGVWKGSKVDVRIDVQRLGKGSKINDSLGAALESQGLGRSLAGVFVEVFEGRIDFYRDTRAGDSFRIVVDEEHVDGKSLGYGTVHALEYVGERVGRLRAYWFEPDGERGDFFDPSGQAMHGGWLRTPLRYDHISSEFNPRRRHPILKRIVPHNGIDYAAAPGTTVWSAADGVVTFAGYKGANGNLITIRHPNGYQTAYAHLSRISRGIKRGTRVRQRQTIGAVGSTGRSTGPHLHFGLKRNGRFVDPAKELNGPGKRLPRRLLTRYKQKVARLQQELSEIPLAPAPSEEEGAPALATPAILD